MLVSPLSPVAAEKAALRARFSAYRTGLSEDDYVRRSRAITNRTAALPILASAHTVHVYWPMTARREVDTRPLIATLRAEGKTVVLPVVDPTQGDLPRLRHVMLDDPDALRPNRWGIGEPVGGASVPVEAIEAVVVPALGAGRNGHRIGYGAGYYDAFLRDLPVPTLGLVYAACLVDIVPVEPHDVPLSILITEEESIRPAPA